MNSNRRAIGQLIAGGLFSLLVCIATGNAYASSSHCPKHSYDPDGADVYVEVVSAERIDRGDRNPEEDTYRVEVSIKVVGGSNRYGYMAGWTIVAGYFDASGQIVKVPQDSDQTHVDAPLYETTEKTTIVVPHQIERRLRGRLINPSFRIESITCQ